MGEVKNYKLPVDYTKLPTHERRAVREQYVEEQEGKCMYCGESLAKPAPYKVAWRDINWDLFPKNFMQYPVHLQHCHKTGLTEGAVHNYCNAVLWQYEGR